MLSVAIMAHPSRERFIPYLSEKLPGAQVVWDQINNRWDTGRRSMLAYNPEASHHLVVQDDALVCNDLIPAVEQATELLPDNPMCFYLGRVRPNAQLVMSMSQKAMRKKVTWIGMSGPWWGVAVCVPTKMIPDMIAWGDGRRDIQNYDLRMSKFFDQERVLCYYSVPSLVSHRTGEDNPSLVPGRGNSDSRVSHNFIGEDVSALTVQWTTEAVYR